MKKKKKKKTLLRHTEAPLALGRQKKGAAFSPSHSAHVAPCSFLKQSRAQHGKRLYNRSGPREPNKSPPVSLGEKKAQAEKEGESASESREQPCLTGEESSRRSPSCCCSCCSCRRCSPAAAGQRPGMTANTRRTSSTKQGPARPRPCCLSPPAPVVLSMEQRRRRQRRRRRRRRHRGTRRPGPTLCGPTRWPRKREQPARPPGRPRGRLSAGRRGRPATRR